jgi:molybdate transport system ATP-binding protein
MQRMVLVARAMVKHPPLLILDEPCSGLDDETAALFTALIHTIAAQTNTAILYVSHKEEAGLLPDKVFQLSPNAEGSIGVVE